MTTLSARKVLGSFTGSVKLEKMSKTASRFFRDASPSRVDVSRNPYKHRRVQPRRCIPQPVPASA